MDRRTMWGKTYRGIRCRGNTNAQFSRGRFLVLHVWLPHSGHRNVTQSDGKTPIIKGLSLLVWVYHWFWKRGSNVSNVNCFLLFVYIHTSDQFMGFTLCYLNSRFSTEWLNQSQSPEEVMGTIRCLLMSLMQFIFFNNSNTFSVWNNIT